MKVQGSNSMPSDMGGPHRICWYLKLFPKVLSTWVYNKIIINPSPPPLPRSSFIHQLFASMTASSRPLLSTSVMEPLLRDLLKLVLYPTSTPPNIRTVSLSCHHLNPSWNYSSKSCITIISPLSLWSSQPSSRSSSPNITSNYLPTHLLTSMPGFFSSTNSTVCQNPPVPPLNFPMQSYHDFQLPLIKSSLSKNFITPFSDGSKTSSTLRPP